MGAAKRGEGGVYKVSLKGVFMMGIGGERIEMGNLGWRQCRCFACMRHNSASRRCRTLHGLWLVARD